QRYLRPPEGASRPGGPDRADFECLLWLYSDEFWREWAECRAVKGRDGEEARSRVAGKIRAKAAGRVALPAIDGRSLRRVESRWGEGWMTATVVISRKFHWNT